MKIRRLFDFYLQEVNFIYLFWAMFWTLNGLDKFFVRVGAEPGSVCYFADGRETPCGWFGTDRAGQIHAYFDKLLLPDWMGAVTVYTFAVMELALGALFIWMLLKSVFATSNVSHMIHRLAFKGSVLMFLLFSTGDILFGDRRELWEHGTFLVLVIITFGVYAYRDELRGQVVRDLQNITPGSTTPRASTIYRSEFHKKGD